MLLALGRTNQNELITKRPMSSNLGTLLRTDELNIFWTIFISLFYPSTNYNIYSYNSINAYILLTNLIISDYMYNDTYDYMPEFFLSNVEELIA